MLAYLLTLANECDHEKITFIYRTYYKKLLHMASVHLIREKCPNAEMDAEDLVQEAFLRIVRHIDKVPNADEPARQRAYVFAIMKHMIFDYLKDRKQIDNIDDHMDELMSEEDLLERFHIQERYDEVMQNLRKLKESYRATFYCRYVEHMSVREIAEEMGVQPGTVEVRLSRGRAQLRALLGQKEEV